MMETINTQSQNEVKDLLNEYVVSPLNTDISTRLSKMSKEIESIEESTKGIGKISPSINGNITRLQGLLNKSFHLDEEDDVIENISSMIEDSQETITTKIDDSRKDVIAQLKTDFQEADKNTNEAAEKNRQELTVGISKQFNVLKELCKELQSASDTSTNEIKSELSDLQTSILKEISTLSTQVEESHEQFEKQSKNIQGSLISKLQEIEVLVIKNNEDLTQQQTLIGQKYKTLFTVSLSFGIVNAIGLIVMIILLLMK